MGEKAIPPGKLPPDMLKRLLERYAPKGMGVVVGPGIGVDAAVLDAGMGDFYLIAKTDPITFVAEDIGSYAVAVNANDVACMGGTPRWFTAAVILPEGGATARLAESIFSSISSACGSLGIALVGGHTEVTHGLDRPIVVGHMLGTVKKDRVITAAGAAPGDRILLTKGIAIEAVSIIAREKYAELIKSPVYPPGFVERCRRFMREPGISVVRDARVAVAAGGVHCLHDPTEGGLSSGLYEIAEASGVGIKVRYEDIPVLPEAIELLGRYGLDPLGVIASGALLITAAPEDAARIVHALEEERIPVRDIGEVTLKSGGVKMSREGRLTGLPVFARDELTRLF